MMKTLFTLLVLVCPIAKASSEAWLLQFSPQFLKMGFSTAAIKGRTKLAAKGQNAQLTAMGISPLFVSVLEELTVNVKDGVFSVPSQAEIEAAQRSSWQCAYIDFRHYIREPIALAAESKFSGRAARFELASGGADLPKKEHNLRGAFWKLWLKEKNGVVFGPGQTDLGAKDTLRATIKDAGRVVRTSYSDAFDAYDPSIDVGYGFQVPARYYTRIRTTKAVFSVGKFDLCLFKKAAKAGTPNEYFFELSATEYKHGLQSLDSPEVEKLKYDQSSVTLIDSEAIVDQSQRGFAQSPCSGGASLAILICR